MLPMFGKEMAIQLHYLGVSFRGAFFISECFTAKTSRFVMSDNFIGGLHE
jgi:hypothetical protein